MHDKNDKDNKDDDGDGNYDGDENDEDKNGGTKKHMNFLTNKTKILNS